MTQRGAFYARVSTARQEQEQTVGSQLEALERVAAAMGVTVPPDRRYVDEGISGSRLDRPSLDMLRDAAADGLLDIVFVYCPDRLARNYVHQYLLVEELQRRDVEVHFVERPVGDRAEDRLLLQMQGVIAEYERAMIIERTRRGKLHRMRMGQSQPYTREPPYGYALVQTGKDTKRVVVIDEVEAQHVRAMYQWVCEEGLSARSVTKRLNAQGIPPRRAKKWNKSVVYKILTDPTYGGHASWGRREAVEPKRPRKPGAHRKKLKSSLRRKSQGQWVTIPVPPIIDEETQQRARDILAKHKILSPRNVQYEYLLRTLVVCGVCGYKMSVGHQHRHGYEYFFYQCKRYNEASVMGLASCSARRVRRDELDAVVWDTIVAWIQTPEMLREEVGAWRMSREGATQRTRELARFEGTVRRLQEQIERLVDAYQAGGITIEELKARRERLEAEKDAAEGRRADIAAQEMDRARVDRLGDDLAA